MDKTSAKTLQDLIRLAAEEYDKPYIKEKSGTEILEHSFKEMYLDAKKIAAYLNEAFNGEKVHGAIIGPSGYAYMATYFGLVSAGNVAVPLDAQLSASDLTDLINRADVNAFFFDTRYVSMLSEIKASCPGIKVFVALHSVEGAEISLDEILEKHAPMEKLPSVSPSDLASIIYTSGTTGKAKGVMLSHGNLMDNVNCCDDESGTDQVLLSILPIHHVYCFTCDFLLSIRYGATVCINDSMMRIAQNLQLFKPTAVLLVPMIIETLYKKILQGAKAKNLPVNAVARSVFGENLECIYSGGAYLAPELSNAYLEMGINIAQGYGMTECSPRICTGNKKDISTKGDVGKIVPGCEVKIVDGEIIVKSPSVMQGYYKYPEATQEALDSEGWLHTGDLGYVEDGRVFITGRKKNLIILSNGENVSPEELENKFAMVNEAKELLVYAEEGFITVEIFPNEECGKKEEIVEKIKDAIKEINLTLPSAKTIRRLRIRDTEFDKTTSKKIKRQQSTQGEIK